MRKVLSMLLIAGMLSVSAVQAGSLSCEQVEDLARAVMTARQKGVPMKVLVGGISEVGMSDKGGDAVKRLIIHAYEMPNYKTQKYEERAINEFSNNYYRTCIKDELDD